MGLMRAALLWGSENRWIERQFRSRGFARRAVRRFMPGEQAADALDEAARLTEQGLTSVVTCLGENVSDRAQAEAVARHYEQTLASIAARSLTSHVSVKLTHLGLDLGTEQTVRNLVAVAGAARATGSFVWVDMEYSRYVDRTLEVLRDARRSVREIGLCLQAYLHRTPADCDALLEEGVTIRLVKGAYREPPSEAIASKRKVDERFFELARRLIERRLPGDRPHGIATHDLRLIDRVRSGAPPDPDDPAWEAQMLFGIQREAQTRLVRSGVPTRTLISYGDAWFPWYMRRLAERPANVGFVLRSMLRG